MSEKLNDSSNADTAKREGNTCLALGIGVGALGAVGAVVSGAVCPLCLIIAPGLIGVGVSKRWCSSTPSNPAQKNPPKTKK